MKKWTHEAKVGLLLTVTLVFAGIFAWMVGFENPLKKTVPLYVTYRFAGGIEIGSPVRVSGIKVGRVEEIDFFVPNPHGPKAKSAGISVQEPGSADDAGSSQAVVPVRVKISVLRKALEGIREDSRFYINLAGVIGERYIEITPGSQLLPPVAPGTTMAGVDPPRIDQLISQSFDLAGKISEVVERNKGDITRSIELLYKLSDNLNTTLKWVEKSKLFQNDLGKLVDNLNGITSDLRVVTSKVQTDEGQRTLNLMHELLWRLEPLDAQKVRDFLQKEGVKATVRFF